MRKLELWNKELVVKAGAVLLAVSLLSGGSAVLAADAGAPDGSDSEATVSEAAVSEAAASEADEEPEDDGEEDEDFFDFEEDISPEEEEMQEYMDANLASDLIGLYDSFRYDQKAWDKDGKETDETGYIYEAEGLVIADFIDGYKEIITDDRYDGYSTELDAPVRYVLDSPETKEDMMLNFEELLFLWGGEEVTEKKEEGETVTFTSVIDDPDMINVSITSYGEAAAEGDRLVRETVFDKASMVFKSSLMQLVKKDGTKNDVFACSITLEPENGYTEDKELINMLDSEDSHSFTLTLDPGTDEEQVIKSKAGKGCVFYPLIYDGYTYYTDEACTEEATDAQMYDKEKDIVLYGMFNENYDDELDYDDDELEPDDLESVDDVIELELDGDEDEIDLSELFDQLEEDDSSGAGSGEVVG